jgi:N-acetylneuraminate lyase
MNRKLNELVAATFTPFDSAGELNLAAIESQAEHHIHNGIRAVFIGGTTGESHSLSVEERLALAKRWSEVAQGSALKVVVHVGSNCLVDARTLAAQAQSLGAYAIAAMAPCYFKPQSVEALVDCCRQIADAAPTIAFYYYDIPVMTGVHLSVPSFLTAAAENIPSLTGVKFTNPDLATFQRCLRFQDGRFDILWGMDQILLAAMACGARGAVGSSYNFATPIYHRMIQALDCGDLAAARAEQYRSVQLIELLIDFGYMASGKAIMEMVGVDVGPARLPNSNLTAEKRELLRGRLDKIGFFDWIRQ